MTRRFLKFMPHGQAQVKIYEDGTKILQSYQTDVARITSDGWLSVTNMQSKTTGRHITAFIKEYAPMVGDQPYQTAKALFLGKFEMDINTGEVQDLEV